MIQYSGSTIVNRSFTPATRADLVNNITQAMSDAGWTTISGTPGSGSDVTLETAAQVAACKIRCRLQDPGGANVSARVSILHPLGTVTESTQGFIDPTSAWRVIANKFTVYAFKMGAAFATGARTCFMAGTLWTPSFITMTAGDAIGFVWQSGNSDTDATARTLFRRQLRPFSSANNPQSSGMWAGNKVEPGSTSLGCIGISPFQGGQEIADQAYRWFDNSLFLFEPLVSWATGTVAGNEARIKGQLYDAIVLSGSWTSEQLVMLDGHTWMNLTDTPATGQAGTACLFVLIA